MKWAVDADCSYFSYCYRNDDFWPEEYRICTERCPDVEGEQWMYSERQYMCVPPDPTNACPQAALVKPSALKDYVSRGKF